MPTIDYRGFFGSAITAFTSPASVDFCKGDPAYPDGFLLTAEQKTYLASQRIHAPEKIIFPKQVHGTNIWCIDEAEINFRGVMEADAIVTDVLELPIAVRTADCLPILIFDVENKVIAAVHAGWKSTQGRIAEKTVRFLQTRWGSPAGELKVALGPCIRPRSYEVGEEFRAHFPEDVAEKNGCLHFDLAGANIRQLTAAGVQKGNIFDCAQDTFTGSDFHSFRRDEERAGRMVSVIMMV